MLPNKLLKCKNSLIMFIKRPSLRALTFRKVIEVSSVINFVQTQLHKPQVRPENVFYGHDL